MVLGIKENDLLDPSKVKLIDGIAGSGKSQSLDTFFKSQGIKYLRLTSTNTLKNDAEQRFGGTVKTICAGIFDNSEGFRTAEKEVEGFNTVVLDEVLQDGWQAIRWVQNHAGSGLNIILTFDSRQLLAPEAEEYTLKVLEELKAEPYTIYTNITKTLRGVTQETRDKVTELYNSVGGFTVGSNVMKEYKTIKLSDLDFNELDVHLCHTLEIEHYLYKTMDYSTSELIGKGQQSGKEVVPGKYPLYDEMTAKLKNVISYYQRRLTGTPVRYQGSEVQPGQRGFYFIESMSVVTNRELYTVVSRFKDINDFVIVNCDGFGKTKELKTLNGKDVKEMRPHILNTWDGETHVVGTEEIIDVISKADDVRYYHSLDVVYSLVDDRLYVQYANEKHLNRIKTTHNMTEDGALYLDLKEKPKGRKSLASSLGKKSPSIQYDFMPDVYEAVGDIFKAPMLSNKGAGKKTDYDHQADLFSAYGTVIKNSKMPVAKCLYKEYDADKLNWYICNNKELNGTNNLITEDLAKLLNYVDCRYVFTTDYQYSNEVGDYAYDNARKSVEDKKNVAALHWGFFEKHYVDMKQTGHKHNTTGEYIIDNVPTLNRKNINELFMCAVKSALAAVMYTARKSVGGGYVITDAIYYNGDKKPDLPNWAWYRISKGGKQDGEYKDIEYQNYDSLKTRQEVKNEKERAKRAATRANETEEEAEERRRKERERKRAQRAKKRQN